MEEQLWRSVAKRVAVCLLRIPMFPKQGFVDCVSACTYAYAVNLNTSYCHLNALLMTQGQYRPRIQELAFIYA
ncbi:hypothetical protein ALC62_01812 [Cyphomyrmex costatus]|uniref:Uncharacterized protein n=1 Tax=Cyphomyrmex costatus TaxID=456900 RepID=A0A151IP58_9HYME|nr:hypothetical protein ALC62_01812 [Cyphomyrmex costatus]